MNDHDITTGLSLLAEGDPVPAIDIDAVITTARLRARRRRALAATAVGAVAVLAAATALTAGSPSSSGPATTGNGSIRQDAAQPVKPVFDDRAANWTKALAAAVPGILPADVTTGQYVPQAQPSDLGHAPALVFYQLDNGYHAAASLTGKTGKGELAVWVRRTEPDPFPEGDWACHGDSLSKSSTPGGVDLSCHTQPLPDGTPKKTYFRSVAGVMYAAWVEVRRGGTSILVSYVTADRQESSPPLLTVEMLTEIAGMPGLTF